MRLERVDDYTLKIFLTFEDLLENGLSITDINKSNRQVQQIIHEMIECVIKELDLQLLDSVDMEIYSLQAQGLIIIIRTNEELFAYDPYLLDDFKEVRQGYKLLYCFSCFEDVLSFFVIANQRQMAVRGSLYYYNQQYYAYLEEIDYLKYDRLKAIASEYGEVSALSIHQVEEYGKRLIKDDAIEKINHYFNKEKMRKKAK